MSNENIRHIHSGGIVGGYSVCDKQGGTLVNDADKSDCVDCVKAVRDWIKQHPGHRYENEVKRACANVGLEF